MTKNLKINRCFDCTNFVRFDGFYYRSCCKIMKDESGMWGRYIDKSHFIPDWCPLDDTNDDNTTLIDVLTRQNKYVVTENARLKNLLEDVINVLDLSDLTIETHGVLGTEPSKLVDIVIEQKNLQICLLKKSFQDLSDSRNGIIGEC